MLVSPEHCVFCYCHVLEKSWARWINLLTTYWPWWIISDPSDNLREILQNVAKQQGVSNMRKLGHLNNFIKVCGATSQQTIKAVFPKLSPGDPKCSRFGCCPSTTQLIQIIISSLSFDYLNQLCSARAKTKTCTPWGPKDRVLERLQRDTLGFWQWVPLSTSPESDELTDTVFICLREVWRKLLTSASSTST